MKVLLVTGRFAEDLVRSFAGGADVLVLDVDVAAFITPRMLMEAKPIGYDLILIPGAITADFQDAEMELSTKIRLGPKHAIDIGFVLPYLDEVELSTHIPACVLLESKMQRNAENQVNLLEEEAESNLLLRSIKIGGTSRMKVLAEIVDAPRLGREALTNKIRYYEEQGADMIDLGIPLDASSSDVIAAINTARSATNLPISLDTVSSDLIMAGIKAGADMILSLNGSNLANVGEAVSISGIPVVVISGPGQISLEENLQRAVSMGITVIADPVLDPPLLGMAASLERYRRFHEEHPDIPLFFGVGNATELLDADTVGVNALLAALGAEVHASILFTPEYSAKAYGSVKELRIASEMMIIAKKRRTPPKDLGIDLLILKEKRHYKTDDTPRDFIKAGQSHKYEQDPAGSFRIHISGDLIFAQNSDLIVAGTSAKDILNTIIDRGVVLRPDHAGYLGRELEKAEIALHLKRSYIQDEPLWPLEKS